MKNFRLNVFFATTFVMIGLTSVLCNNKDKQDFAEANKMSSYNDLSI